MAYISSENLKKLEKIDLKKQGETTADYAIFIQDNGEKIIQINTYGSKDRVAKGKMSQTIQFNDEVLRTFLDNMSINEISEKSNKFSECKNIIYCGPPGTGKTYNVIGKALEIINKEKYSNFISRDKAVQEFNKFLESGQIAFCTFHQSYGYEDFVEGLRSNEDGNGFAPKDGIFKQICSNALVRSQKELSKYDFKDNEINFYKMSLGDTNTNDNSIYDYCLKENCIALGWGEGLDYSDCKNYEDVKKKFNDEFNEAKERNFNVDAVDRFINGMKVNDIVIISFGNKKARAIGKIIGEYYYDDATEINFEQFRKVEWLYTGEPIDVKRILKGKQFSQQAIYKFSTKDIYIENIRELVSDKELKKQDKNYILIIDEINRGNISKIFGELITLIEEDKRLGEKNQLKVTLPYSNESFGVPNNLYIIGTMNTADRSIALLDTALRRRFEFVEYMPNIKLLSKDVEGINLQLFLEIINKRIEFLFDRDHTIGHAYFMNDNLDFEILVSIMKNKIIPLLQEYFYGDWEKIELILGGSGKNNDYFINKEKVNVKDLFSKNISYYNEQYKYSIVENPNKQAFFNVYKIATENNED
ncbi:hypothetical protein DVV81_12980 [Clostridium botulinum]|uniref:AAA family ATPase n=1 Tax=Clostridium botulinum TaxID=1491 RepID=UPI001967EFC0|nr:AAA family ATPase [Clostridium botulinum]MBN1072073.1 hypothetical protein [Clostridium botulinum]